MVLTETAIVVCTVLLKCLGGFVSQCFKRVVSLKGYYITGNFHDMKISRIWAIANFANSGTEELLSFPTVVSD